MSQQPLLLQRDETRFAGNFAIPANAGYPWDATAGDPVTVFFDDPVKPELGPQTGLASEKTTSPKTTSKKTWFLAFQGLRIAIASAQAGSRERIVRRHADLADFDLKDAWCPSGVASLGIALAGGAVTDPASDPVIGRLSDALEAAESAGDQHSRIYADAVRLAIAIRLLGQSEARRAVLQDDLVEQASVVRQARALQKWRLKRVLDYIDNHLSGKITLVDLATVAGLSRMHFASQFRAAMGLRPHEYLLRQRIRRAEELLLHSTMPIVEVALTVGFQTQAHFTTVFKRFMGHTPCQWRNAHHGGELSAI